ncbi:hypothetical protein B5S28_g1423 [[Candida] boidinii]|nr:hypothetical protein B5S28_g1423 [[Candida] boidinii]
MSTKDLESQISEDEKSNFSYISYENDYEYESDEELDDNKEGISIDNLKNWILINLNSVIDNIKNTIDTTLEEEEEIEKDIEKGNEEKLNKDTNTTNSRDSDNNDMPEKFNFTKESNSEELDEVEEEESIAEEVFKGFTILLIFIILFFLITYTFDCVPFVLRVSV